MMLSAPTHVSDVILTQHLGRPFFEYPHNGSMVLMRPNVGVFLRHAGKLLVGQRADAQTWQCPQGGLDLLPTGELETPLLAAQRELFEETGIPATDIHLQAGLGYWLPYFFPPEVLHQRNATEPDKIPIGCFGQLQTWYLFDYTGNPADINVTTAPDPEFAAHAWRPPSQILTDIVTFKRAVYQQALTDLGVI